MARLTGEAARRWLAENPNASYIDNRTGQKKIIVESDLRIGKFL